MKTRLINFAGRRVLVLKPHEWAFGHLGLEILMALNLARTKKADLFVLPSKKIMNAALLRLRCDEVCMVADGTLQALFLKALWRLTMASEHVEDVRADFRHWWNVVTESYDKILRQRAKLIYKDPKYPSVVRKEIKAAMARHEKVSEVLADAGTEAAGPYYRRSLIKDPVRVRLSAKDEAAALAQAREFGITPATPIVTWHVREPGFKSMGGHQEGLADLARNARPDDYLAAVDYLVQLGYTVVRLGDSTMTPIRRTGVVDLAPRADLKLLELWSLMHSKFLLGCDSGPYSVALLTNTPCLIVNATNPINSYPIRPNSLYLLKRVARRDTGEALSLTDLLSEEYLVNWRMPTDYVYSDNTPDEILVAVKEMLQHLDRPQAPSAAQLAYRDLVHRRASELREKVSYIGKWGMEAGFLGDGRIALTQVEGVGDIANDLATIGAGSR